MFINICDIEISKRNILNLNIRIMNSRNKFIVPKMETKMKGLNYIIRNSLIKNNLNYRHIIYYHLERSKNSKTAIKDYELQQALLKKLHLEKAKWIVLGKRYKPYIKVIKKDDALRNENSGYNIMRTKKNYLSNSKYVNLEINKTKWLNCFNSEKNKRGRMKDGINKLVSPINVKEGICVLNNIIEGHQRDIDSRKISNKLLIPSYFFTAKYIENSMLSQTRHWSHNVYTFLQKEGAQLRIWDVITSELIKRFFTLNNIKIKKMWNKLFGEGIKLQFNFNISNNLNNIIQFTTKEIIKRDDTKRDFSPGVLKAKWFKKQLEFTINIRRLLYKNKVELLGKVRAKRKLSIKKLRRVLISKPIFKHTSSNLIIDLFVFNNKSFRFNKLKNLLLRRITYKYMYSMYVDSYKKINETLNRPRFFYMNLIEPKIFPYYMKIVNSYQNVLTGYNKSIIITICMLLLNLNKYHKNYVQLLKNKVLSYRYNKFIFDKSSLINKFSKKFFNKEEILGFYNKNKNKVDLVKKDDNEVTKKNKKLKIYKTKNYFKELEWKSITPVDIKSLTLWSRKGLGRKNKKKEDSIRIKKFGEKKISYIDYKKSQLYNKGKKVGPKELEQKIMAFHLYSRHQKKNIKSNKKTYVWYSNKETWLNKQKNRKSNLLHEFKFNKELVNVKDNKFYEKKEISNNYIRLFNMKESSNVDKQINYLLPKFKSKVGELGIKRIEKINVKKLDKDMINDNKELEKYVEEVNIRKYNNNSMKDMFLKKFYIYKTKESNQNLIKNKLLFTDIQNINKFRKFNKLIIDQDQEILDKKRILKFKNIKQWLKRKDMFNYIKLKNIDENDLKDSFKNSKKIWDKLDYSLLSILSNILILSAKSKSHLDFLSLNSIYKKSKNIYICSDIWYTFYSLSFIKKEYSLVVKDILISKLWNVINLDTGKMRKNYVYLEENEFNVVWSRFNLFYKTVWSKLWPSYVNNKRREMLKDKIFYYENIFKSYYRYMIPIYIIEYYKYFMLNIWKNAWVWNINMFSNNYINKLNNSNTYVLYNFVIVKTLLGLMQYNYRSLINLKSKYYHLNKLRYYSTKFIRLNFNSWANSVKYVKKLRKTPKNFWNRYHKLASFYFGRIIQNAELDTKRKIFVPFVLYFEDILFNIYGKWVIIRLWPLKKYFLSSYILARRLMVIILTRNKKSRKNFTLPKFAIKVNKLITALKVLQIKRKYDYYISSSSRWPNSLIKMINIKSAPKHLNYKMTEYLLEKQERAFYFNTRSFSRSTIFSDTLTNWYLSTINSSLNVRTKSYFKDIKYNIKRPESINNTCINYRYFNKWLKPFRLYIHDRKKEFDISSFRFLIKGRTSSRPNNKRASYRDVFYGNVKGPKYWAILQKKFITIGIPTIRGEMKCHYDYAMSTSKSKSGALSVKVWITSKLTYDIQELLLHLLDIKNLYLQLVNRFYNVPFIFKTPSKNIKRNKFLFYKSYLINKKKKPWNKSGLFRKHTVNLFIKNKSRFNKNFRKVNKNL
jgi:hypothetical protein